MHPFTYRPGADEPLGHAVVTAAASVSDCRATKSAAVDSSDVLPPLYEAIDPDALDALFRRPERAVPDEVADAPDTGASAADASNASASDTGASTADGPNWVEFSYHGFRITVRSDRSVTVEAE